MSEKITAMIEEIKALTVLELSELVKAIEYFNGRDRRFGGV
jgi:ribosomal protein L7/L12